MIPFSFIIWELLWKILDSKLVKLSENYEEQFGATWHQVSGNI